MVALLRETFPDLGQMDEVLADLLFGELIRRLVVMFGKRSNGAEIDILGCWGKTVQLQVVDESFT